MDSIAQKSKIFSSYDKNKISLSKHIEKVTLN